MLRYRSMARASAVPLCLLVASMAAYAKYKPNGPPLFVCAGAVPLEPNTDALEQDYVPLSAYDKPEPKVIIATAKDRIAEALRLIGPSYGRKPENFDTENLVYCFYFVGSVPERAGSGAPTRLLPEVFGVERQYVRNGPAIHDMVTFHLVVQDIRPKAPMSAQSPVVIYGIRKADLDTEHSGTPPVTSYTRFEAIERRVTVNNHFSAKDRG